MKTLILGTAVNAAAVAAQTGVLCNATPFLAGRDVVARIRKEGVTGSPTIKIQSSPDNSTWTDEVSTTTLTDVVANIKCGQYMRLNVTVAGGAGTVSASLDNGT